MMKSQQEIEELLGEWRRRGGFQSNEIISETGHIQEEKCMILEWILGIEHKDTNYTKYFNRVPDIKDFEF